MEVAVISNSLMQLSTPEMCKSSQDVSSELTNSGSSGKNNELVYKRWSFFLLQFSVFNKAKSNNGIVLHPNTASS